MMEKQKGNKEKWLRLPIQYFGGSGDPQDPPTDPPTDPQDPPATLTAEEVQKMIQAEADRVRTEYSKKNKVLQDQLDEEKKSKMTEQQRAELKEKELLDKEQALQKKENEIFAIGALSDAVMPATFLKFVTASSDEETTEKIKTLKEEFDKAVAAEVDKTFKGTGRKHVKGAEGTGNTLPTNFAELAKQNNIRN